MKFSAATIFTFLLLLQTFSKWIVLVNYTVNRDYIAKTLCENRDKPKLNCNGKCQLMKNMAAEEDQNNKTSSGSSIAKLSFSEFWPTHNLMSSIDISVTVKSVHHSFYLITKPASFHSSIFHPPLA